MGERSYEDGVREGQFNSLKIIQAQHEVRLDKVETRVSTLERVAYIVLGAIALVQIAPALKGFMG